MIIRKYQPSDSQELARLFYDTVHTINARDYNQEQLNVWATRNIDLEKWNQSFLKHYTVVAVDDRVHFWNRTSQCADLYAVWQKE